jgi:uncharacterized protein YndB with AHSA1/START domain
MEEQQGITGKTSRVELGTAEIALELVIPKPPEETYRAFVNDIGRWWSRDYIMGRAKTTELVLEDVPGGRLLEKWSGTDGAIWALVVQVERGRRIHLGIPDGVIWSGPGYLTVTFADDESGGTVLKLNHLSTQLYSDDGNAGYVTGWKTLVMERFVEYVANGTVEGAVNEG